MAPDAEPGEKRIATRPLALMPGLVVPVKGQPPIHRADYACSA